MLIYLLNMTTKLRVKFDGKTLIPTGPVDLPMGEELEIEVRDTTAKTDSKALLGSAKSILQALAQPPHLSKEDVEELEHAITESHLPLADGRIFDEGAE